ncbi:AAA family ATPase [Alcaligenaceae bacterium CGII-47]|nr:AAA family ATPase [Alcaligenaceae bacterium CGII-47]
MTRKVTIRRLHTGVPGLDALLGGGLPEFSFNLVAGAPGSGKTTLAHAIMFSLANPERRALFFTVLGEPPLKMLRYQQQFSFFDFRKINNSIRFVNLSADLLAGNFDLILARITKEVEGFSPSLVFVDSFRSVVRSGSGAQNEDLHLQHFIQRLGVRMASWQATTFLIGGYPSPDTESSPICTVADGILWLSQSMYRDSMVRKIQVVKMRGQATHAGLHTFRITDDGVEIFPRTIRPHRSTDQVIPAGDRRLSMGIPELDRMLGGGLPIAYSMLVVGPSGSGKTVLATEFLAEGVRVGEPGVIAAFEKSPNQLLSHKLNKMIKAGEIGLINTRSLDMSIDETVHNLIQAINQRQAKRVVIDSLSGFELALAPAFRENFRDALYRMVAILTSMGVTVLMTAELEDRYTDLRFSSYGSAFLVDAIIMQRYVIIKGCFQRVISVVKIRSSQHSKEIRSYEIGHDSFKIGEVLTQLDGLR